MGVRVEVDELNRRLSDRMKQGQQMGKTIIAKSFYLTGDVTQIAVGLLGKILCTRIGGHYTSGMICETEAYEGITDRASHAFGGRRTTRNEIMYGEGGYAYVYLCYGIHSLFNVVTNVAGIPHAVLIRGIIPREGIPVMLERAGAKNTTQDLGIGPGKLTKLLGIHYSQTGTELSEESAGKGSPAIWIEDRGILVPSASVVAGPRVGVSYAGEDALLPYRYRIAGTF